MESLKLTSEYRVSSGKGVSRRLRAQGRVPAVLYGHSEESVKISIDEADFLRVLRVRGETAIIGLTVEGEVKKDCDAIIKEIQQHPASGEILHVDFQHIRRGEKIKIDVPVELLGEPLGVKEMGGVLEHGPRELVIRCLPRDIPERITVDVSGLKMHDAIHVKDIAAQHPGFEFLDDLGTTIAIVVPSRIEEAAPVPVAEEVAEPEVIGKGKEGEKKEEEAAGTEEASPAPRGRKE
jgi:large subunit ribosomal protein L25